MGVASSDPPSLCPPLLRAFLSLSRVPALASTLQAMATTHDVAPLLRYLLPHLIHAVFSPSPGESRSPAPLSVCEKTPCSPVLLCPRCGADRRARRAGGRPEVCPSDRRPGPNGSAVNAPSSPTASTTNPRIGTLNQSILLTCLI